MSQRSRDIGRKYLIGSQKTAKAKAKKSKQKTRMVRWTSMWTELPQKIEKKRKNDGPYHSEDGDNIGSQLMMSQIIKAEIYVREVG